MRRSKMEATRRIFATILELHMYRGQSIRKEEIIKKLEAQILILWKTDEVRMKKPTVEDEVRNGLYYFNTSLFKAVPQMYRDLENATKRIYCDSMTVSSIKVPSFLRFGSWIGGDRDGNPYVTPEVTQKAVYMHSKTALKENIMVYVEPFSFILVLGGTIGATCLSAEAKDMKGLGGALKQLIFKPKRMDSVETVKILEKRLAHITKPITLSIIGCVVNGPGEAAMTDVGITGGKKGNNMLYLSGVQSEKVLTSEMIERVVFEVEKKAAELENN